MAYYNGKKVMAVVDYKPAILIEKEITKGGEYNASDDNADGYSKVVVGAVKPEGNPLQYVIDNQGGDGVPSCKNLFYNYKGSSLDSALKGLYTSNIKVFKFMFSSCSNLISISQLDTSSAEEMDYMFQDCRSLTTIPQLDTSSVMSMSGMFYSCYNLNSIPQLDTSSVEFMQDMFNGCRSLTTIPQLDTSSVRNMNGMFYNCTKLTSIGIYGFTRSIDITPTALEHDAIVAFLNQAGTAYNSSQKITMGSAKLALLSDEEKAIATNKGWTLA